MAGANFNTHHTLNYGTSGGKVMMVVVMTAVVIAGVVIMSNLFNCMLGGSICCAGSCSGATIGFGGSFRAHNHQQKKTPPRPTPLPP